MPSNYEYNPEQQWTPQLPEQQTYERPVREMPSYLTDQNNPAYDHVFNQIARRDYEQNPYQQMTPQMTQQQRAQDRTAPPRNPQEALNYQFYGAQDASQRQEQQYGQQMESYGRQQQAIQQEHAAVEASKQEAMRQKQATLQHWFSLMNQGGQNSLASIMSPIASQMANTWDMGVRSPDPSPQVYGEMARAAGQTQFGMPDYTAWIDPEAYRTSWYLPQYTQQRQTLDFGPVNTAPRQNQFYDNSWFDSYYG